MYKHVKCDLLLPQDSIRVFSFLKEDNIFKIRKLYFCLTQAGRVREDRRIDERVPKAEVLSPLSCSEDLAWLIDQVARKNVANRIIEWANATASFCGARSSVPGQARDAPGLYLNHSIRHAIID